MAPCGRRVITGLQVRLGGTWGLKGDGRGGEEVVRVAQSWLQFSHIGQLSPRWCRCLLNPATIRMAIMASKEVSSSTQKAGNWGLILHHPSRLQDAQCGQVVVEAARWLRAWAATALGSCEAQGWPRCTAFLPHGTTPWHCTWAITTSSHSRVSNRHHPPHPRVSPWYTSHQD